MRLKFQFGSQSGFSVTELMIIIVIIGILASVAIASYQTRVRQAHLATIYHEINEFRAPYQILVYEGSGVTTFSPSGLNLSENTQYCRFSVTAPHENGLITNAVTCTIQNLNYLQGQSLTLDRAADDNWSCRASRGISKSYLPQACR